MYKINIQKKQTLPVLILCLFLLLLTPPTFAFFGHEAASWIVTGSLQLIAIGGNIFLGAINLTILELPEIINPNGGWDIIKLTWQLFRDIINILITVLFIFTAFSSILDNLNFKKSILVWLILASILNNFSAFFVLAAIDIANALILVIFNLVLSLGIVEIIAAIKKISTALIKEETAGVAEGLLYAFVFLAGGVCIFFAYIANAIALIIRFVHVITLVVTSPFGVLGFLVSKSKEEKGLIGLVNIYSKKWNNLFVSIFIVPLIMLFSLFFGSVILANLIQDERTADNPYLTLIYFIIGTLIFLYINIQGVKASNSYHGSLGGAGKIANLGRKAFRWTANHAKEYQKPEYQGPIRRTKVKLKKEWKGLKENTQNIGKRVAFQHPDRMTDEEIEKAKFKSPNLDLARKYNLNVNELDSLIKKHSPEDGKELDDEQKEQIAKNRMEELKINREAKAEEERKKDEEKNANERRREEAEKDTYTKKTKKESNESRENLKGGARDTEKKHQEKTQADADRRKNAQADADRRKNAQAEEERKKDEEKNANERRREEAEKDTYTKKTKKESNESRENLKGGARDTEKKHQEKTQADADRRKFDSL